MSITPIGSYNEAIRNTWKEGWVKSDPLRKYYPLLYEKGQVLKASPCKLLIIGLNPSFSEFGIHTILSKFFDDNNGHQLDRRYRNRISHSFKKKWSKTKTQQAIDKMHKWDGKVRLQSEEDMNALQNAALKYYTYFEAFRVLLPELGIQEEELVFIDLFNVREKKAKIIEGAFLNREHIDFFTNQLTLNLDLINLIHPSKILIANAFVARILTDSFGTESRNASNERPDSSYRKSYPVLNQFGVHYDKIHPNRCTMKLRSGTQIPIFFSSMLGGQRAMDIFSRDRLLWSIRNHSKLKNI